MPLLSDVPNEILNHILGFIPKSDLLNLCLTNTSLRSAAEPFFYSTIILEWERNCIPRIIPLLRTLLQRPELFNYIDTVSMNGWSFEGDYARALDLDSVDISFDQCIDAIKNTKVPYTDLWIEKLRSGTTCLEALSALFLYNLSRPKRLALTTNFINGRHLIGKVFQSKSLGGSGLPAFEQLKEVKYVKGCDYADNRNNRIFSEVISLFYISTVTDIVAWIPNPPVFKWPAGEPMLDNLTSLDIMRLSEENLAKILALTRNLKSLLWTWQCEDSDDLGNTMILNFENILKALSSVRGTLEKLQLRLEVVISRNPVFEPKITALGSLAGLASFDRITYLEVPFISLAGFGDTPLPLEDGVPTSVRTLALSDDMLLDDAIAWHEPYYERYPYGYAPAEGIDNLIEALGDNIPMKLPLLRDLVFLDDGSFGPIFELVDFNATMDIYAYDDFNIRVETREPFYNRHCYGWRTIPDINYNEKSHGPRWAK